MGAEDAGQVQSLGARFAHDLISLDYAAEMGCRACGSSGGGCQFLGTAATSQVVAEALGMALPHTALAPSGEPAWIELGERSALALIRLHALEISLHRILTSRAIENAMLVHAAFGGSTNLLLHIPAIAHAAGLPVPTVEDWHRVNLSTPRLVDALPNGPRGFPTVQVFMAGGVPEVMLHLRRMGLLNCDVMTATRATRSTQRSLGTGERRVAAKPQRRSERVGRRRDHEPRQSSARRDDEHHRVSDRQPRARRCCRESDGNRSLVGRCQRSVSPSRPGARIHRRA
jgi:dihydroxyacid dehydratase/phosphogluconate dehydratase